MDSWLSSPSNVQENLGHHQICPYTCLARSRYYPRGNHKRFHVSPLPFTHKSNLTQTQRVPPRPQPQIRLGTSSVHPSHGHHLRPCSLLGL